MNLLRIATRTSPLALAQSQEVAGLIGHRWPGVEVELVPVLVAGDRILDRPLREIDGKALFVKELETAMLEGRADLAVHSMKDVTAEVAEEFVFPAFLPRADPRDVIVATNRQSLDNLRAGSRVGTSSLRRRCQLLHAFPHLEILDIRGNVGTRLKKLEKGEFDALALAAAGLLRLGLETQISSWIAPQTLVPAIGQGIIGIECLRENYSAHNLLDALDHGQTRLRIAAERALNRALGGDCHAPMAGYAATEAGGQLSLHGLVGDPAGERLFTARIRRHIANEKDAQELGLEAADKLIAQGADNILQELKT